MDMLRKSLAKKIRIGKLEIIKIGKLLSDEKIKKKKKGTENRVELAAGKSPFRDRKNEDSCSINIRLINIFYLCFLLLTCCWGVGLFGFGNSIGNWN